MQILKPAILYFALVFGAGFVLGTIRVLPVVPRIGTRTAELMETRVMIVVSFLAARWIIRRFAVPPSATERIAIGLVALALLLAAKFTFVLWLRVGQSANIFPAEILRPEPRGRQKADYH